MEVFVCIVLVAVECRIERQPCWIDSLATTWPTTTEIINARDFSEGYSERAEIEQ